MAGLMLGAWSICAEPARADEQITRVSSPDGAMTFQLDRTGDGKLSYSVQLDGAPLLSASPLGLVTSLGRWTHALEVRAVRAVQSLDEQYRMKQGPCSTCHYRAHRQVIELANAQGARLDFIVQVSNDGLAFRYRIPQQQATDSATAFEEFTGFQFAEDTRSWLTPMHDPVSGWQQTFPAYEGHYQMDEPVGTPSPTGVGWALPALFHKPEAGWALVTEAGLDGAYFGSRLRARSDGLYRLAGPEPGEGTGISDPVTATFALPFQSPWRVVIVGREPGAIVESTLVTDVSPPSTLEEATFIQPGKVAWSWLPMKDESIVPDVQRRFIDMAAEYGFAYCLIDNWWDEQIGYEGVEALVDYAEQKGVGIFLWYNSNGAFNNAPQTPQDRMHTARARRAEFARLQEMGVRGVKVDFFGGDKQSVIQLYLDLFRDAAEHGLMVNVHGSTVPRGWQRTYPSFMTSEAVRGYEYITFSQADADAAPRHATVLPFTRNVAGPMDFTPTMLTDSVGFSKRRTSNAFDLAMPVIFTSGLQHLGVTPESLSNQPESVQNFLRAVPAAWDETRFIDGYPGEYVVLARRSGRQWFVAGFNGEAEARAVRVPLNFGRALSGTLLTDGSDPRSIREQSIGTATTDTLNVNMPGRGGFVLHLTPDAQ